MKNILCNIYVFTDTTEASFASKMLATLNPDKPIWDSRVLHFLGLKPTGKSGSDRQDSIIEIAAKDELVKEKPGNQTVDESEN